MSKEEEKEETRYPLRSLHDFLYELDKEWDRFRTGSLIGVIVSFALLLFTFVRMLAALRNRAPFDFVFMVAIIGALIYTISNLLAQHRFFRKWERRIGLLLHMEKKILSEELEKDN
jgi:RsiW-degrading membrane proteinase PrsW (M82 family)